MPYRENNNQNDAELAIKLRDTGDASAFEVLYKRHSPLLSSFLFRLAGGRAPSLVPKMAERLRDRSYAIRDVENFHLWALGVVASFWREETKHDEPPSASDPAAFQVIHRMAFYLRPVFILVHYFQLPIDDVAAALRIPRGTATSRLQDAFASLVAQVAPAEPPPLPEYDEPSVIIEDLSSNEAIAEVLASEAASPSEEKPAPEPVIVANEAPASEAEKAPLSEEPAPVSVLAELEKLAEKSEEAPASKPEPTPLSVSSEPPLHPSPPPIPKSAPTAAAVPPPAPLMPPTPLLPLAPPLFASPPTSAASGSALAALIPKLSFPSTEPPKEPEKS